MIQTLNKVILSDLAVFLFRYLFKYTLGALACHIVWLYRCMLMKRMMLDITSATSCILDPAAMH